MAQVSVDKENLGKLMYVTHDFNHIFGFKNSEVIGDSINLILPTVIA